MALDREQSLIWQAMNIGAQWILRNAEDPLEVVAPEKVSTPAHASVPGQVSPTTQVRTQPTLAGHHKPIMPAVDVAATPIKRPLRTVVEKSVAAPVETAKSVQADASLMQVLKTATWESIADIAKQCHVCSMAAERTHVVVADGAPGCPFVIVGEAPGRDEDIQGIPFVGKSGQLLTTLLEVTGMKRREDVAIVNVLKCRPPRNRDPRPDEVAACAGFLDRQLELLAPEVLILMGRHAVERMLGKTESIARLRGQTHWVTIAGREVPCVVTYHPSYLLRSPVEKEKSWQDLLRAKKLRHTGKQ